jgi:tripartite-type tricarboxylate transporter receptor subunit TctC
LSIAIGGIGSSLHLAGEQLKLMADVRILNVPYKGTAPALTDVLGGQVDMMFISLVTGTAQVRAGKLRAYASPRVWAHLRPRLRGHLVETRLQRLPSGHDRS